MVGLIALAALPLLLLAALSAWQGVKATETRVAEERIALARAAALRAGSFVDDNLSTVRTLALTGEMTDPANRPDMTAFLNELLRANPEWEGAGIADQDRWNLANTAAPPRTLNIGDRPYFQELLASGRAVVSPAILNRRTGNPTVVVAAPIEFRTGGRGAVIVSLSTVKLGADLRALRDSDGIEIAVLDSEGKIFIRPGPTEAEPLPLARGRPAADAVLAGQTGSLIGSDPRGREVLIAYAPEPNAGWGVLVTQPTSAAFDLVRRQLAQQLSLLGFAVALTGLIGWHLGGRLNRFYQAEVEAKAQAEAVAGALREISKESEGRRRFLEDLIAAAPVAIAVLEGPEHRFTTVNPAYQALKPAIEMLGRSFAEVFPELRLSGSAGSLDYVYTTGQRYTAIDRRVGIDDGSGREAERYFTSVVARYEDANRQPAGVLIIALETTDAVLTRQRADREKDEFLSTASHELKTPLSSLVLSSQMIERMLTRDTLDQERLERLVKAINLQVNRASGLIGDLLDISRLDFGTQQLRRQPVDLVRLAAAAAQRERDTLPDGDPHEIVVEPPNPLTIVVRGDEPRLDQVFTNLLSNAVKYSPDGGPVQIRLSARDGSAVFSVVDHGLGIPPDERDGLFSAFSRTDSARTSGIEGTGLGLYIARRIVEAHGGTIGLADTPGGGATFTVTLPLADG